MENNPLNFGIGRTQNGGVATIFAISYNYVE